VEEEPQEVVGSEGDVEVRDIQQVASDVVDPVVHPDFTTGRTESSFAGERDTQLVLSAWADVESVAAVGVTAQLQALDDLIVVGPLIWGHFVVQPQIAPAVPVVEEDLAEAIVSGGGVGATPRG
jgi:hypothetical protein